MSINEFSYSLIIPTRNRQSYAICAVESALNCDYDKLQIIISDNSDNDSLRLMIEERGWMDRVVYHKTKSILSMKDNWAEGLDIASGEYVSVIGDDDAVLPDTFLICNAILSKVSLDVINAKNATYKWPDYPFPGRRNYLGVPMGCGISVVSDLHELLRKSINLEMYIGTGPSVYRGIVSRDFLLKMRQLRGEWFIEHMPDLDSGYAVLMYAKKMIRLQTPLFISGHCGSSNSGAMRESTYFTLNAMEYCKESHLSDYSSLFFLENINNIKAAVLAGMMRLMPEIRSVLGDDVLEIDKQKAIQMLADNLADGYESVSFMSETEILKKIAEAFGLANKINFPQGRPMLSSISDYRGLKLKKLKSDAKQPESSVEMIDQSIVVDGNRAGFKNILDAVKFAASILPGDQLLSGGVNTDVYSYFRAHKCRKHKKTLETAINLLKSKDYSEAEKIVIEVCTEDPLNSEAYRILGNIRLSTINHAGAAAAFARSLSINANYQDSEKYIFCLCQLGLIDKAQSFVNDLASRSQSEKTEEFQLRMKKYMSTFIEVN